MVPVKSKAGDMSAFCPKVNGPSLELVYIGAAEVVVGMVCGCLDCDCCWLGGC